MTPCAPFWFVGGCLVLASVVTSSMATIPGQPQLGTSGEAAVERQTPVVDCYGDPLPRGAIARLGTTRFRQSGAVWALAYSPDGKLLASTDHTSKISLWNVATGKVVRHFLHSDCQCSVVTFSRDGALLAAGGENGFLGVWEVATGKTLASVCR